MGCIATTCCIKLSENDDLNNKLVSYFHERFQVKEVVEMKY